MALGQASRNFRLMSERNERVVLARTQGIHKSEMRNVARRSYSNMDTRAGTHGLINDYLDAAGHGLDEAGALFRPVRNNRTGRLEGAITADGVYRVMRRFSGSWDS
jgi:hypothetical protein